MKFTTAVFDLDGTLLDTLGDLCDSVNHVLSLYSCPQRSLCEVRAFIGNGIRNLVKRSFPVSLSDAELDERTEAFRSFYAENMENKTAPYAGVPELLCGLKEKGVKIAVVSNKFDAGVKKLCDRYFPDIIPVAVGESASVSKKPAPDLVFAALSTLGANKQGAVYIGDSETDAQTAKNAGLPFLGVAWGFRSRELLVESGAFLVAEKPSDIEAVF